MTAFLSILLYCLGVREVDTRKDLWQGPYYSVKIQMKYYSLITPPQFRNSRWYITSIDSSDGSVFKPLMGKK